MTPAEPRPLPKSRRYVIAKEQPQYNALVARAQINERHQAIEMVTEWVPDDNERALIAAGGRVQLRTLTFGQPFQPVTLSAVAALSDREAAQAPAEAHEVWLTVNGLTLAIAPGSVVSFEQIAQLAGKPVDTITWRTRHGGPSGTLGRGETITIDRDVIVNATATVNT